jgi:hypothetical protein
MTRFTPVAVLAAVLLGTSALAQAPQLLIMPDANTAPGQLRAQPTGQQYQPQQPVGSVSAYAPNPDNLGPAVNQLQAPNPGQNGQQQYQPPSGYQTQTPTQMDVGGSLKAIRKPWEGVRNSSRQVEPGVIEHQWSPTRVMPITLGPLAPATILFPSWEQILPATIYPGSQLLTYSIVAPNQLELRALKWDFDGALKMRGSSGALYTFWITAVSPEYDGKSDLIVIVKNDAVANASTLTAAPPSSSRLASGALPQSVAALATNATGYQPNQSDIPLSSALQAVIPAGTAISVPHQIYEQNPGDYEAIGPRRIVQTPDFTIFDFGADAASRPRPTIQRIVSGVDGQTTNFYSVPEHPEIVIADRKGSFTFSWNGQIVCAVQTNDPRSGLAVSP